MLKEDFECVFIYKNILPTLLQDIHKVCETSITIPPNLSYQDEAFWMCKNIFCGKEILVLDGYNFDTMYQKIIKPSVSKLVCIDDICAYHFVADAVINHSGGFSKKDYSLANNTKLFASLDYLLLRKSFREIARNRNYNKRQKGAALICMGGADPQNFTLDLIKNLVQIHEIQSLYIVLGKAYPHMEITQEYIKTISKEINLLQNLSAKEMVNLMQICPIAITSASTISYEYLSVGGLLFLKVIADNQKHVFQYLIQNNLAFSLEKLLNINKINQSLVLKKQKEIFDGKQEERLISIFKNLIS